MKLFLVIDLGTTDCKSLLIDENGKTIENLLTNWRMFAKIFVRQRQLWKKEGEKNGDR